MSQPERPLTFEPLTSERWTDLEAPFRRAGFVEVARRSETRPIMQYEISQSAGSP